jgi:pimeloyl-ACP methyl ester carboxylesterase
MLRLLVTMGGVVGGWLLYSAVGINHQKRLPQAVVGERRTFYGKHSCQLNYYADTSAAGCPLVLVHSINAAASAYEMKPLYDAYRGKRPVYALELPGFGYSERSQREYSPILYTAALLDFLQQIIGEAADVIALSLSGEFAAHAAHQQPHLFQTLTLISPTGFTAGRNFTDDAQYEQITQGAQRWIAQPLWAQGLYDLLVIRPSLQFFLQQSFQGKVDAGLLGYAYATSHQPGARHAPLAFISGKLFTPRMAERVYQHLTRPTLILYDQDANVTFDLLPQITAQNPCLQAQRIPNTRGLPHFDEPAATLSALEAFWAAHT